METHAPMIEEYKSLKLLLGRIAGLLENYRKAFPRILSPEVGIGISFGQAMSRGRLIYFEGTIDTVDLMSNTHVGMFAREIGLIS